MIRFFDLFRIRKEERWIALAALAVIITLNVLMICAYFNAFAYAPGDGWKTFVSVFRVSGYDPITYGVVTKWTARYNVYRHPLLAFFMYIPYLLNALLMKLTGINLVQVIVACILVFCSFYSFMFIFRIFRDVIKVSFTDSTILAWFFFSFAYIMIATMVPDHFIISTMMLLLALYVCGLHIEQGKQLKRWPTVLLFIVTAGITLSNGIKIFIYALFVNGRKFFRLRYILPAIILPAVMIWVFAKVEYRHFVWPSEMARSEARARHDANIRKNIYKAYADTAHVKDSALIAKSVNKVIQMKAKEKYKRDHKQPWNQHTGKPISNGEFMRWTDISTSRLSSVVENLFGESIQLHRDHLLEDTLRSRPVIIPYRWSLSYIIEAIIVALFVVGIFIGRRSRFLWMALAGFGFDLLLHIGLGFGINEVYIMGPHWLFVIPIGIAFLMKRLTGQPLKVLRGLLIVITLYLWAYNSVLALGYILS
jgi:hypothetical protein